MDFSQPAAGEEWKAMDASAVHGGAAGEDAVLAEARRNIERLRRGDVELRLVDRAGRPVANLAVEILQQRQAFCFGDQLWTLDTHARHGEFDHDQSIYFREHFARLFNSATALCYWTERPRNDGPKTEEFQGAPRYEHFAWCVAWAASRGLTVKGHPLFWSIPKCIPDWALRYDPATLMRFAEVRVRSLVARFKGQVRIWDAVNEAMWEAAPAHLAQRHWPHIEPIDIVADYVSTVLDWCRAEDPDACYLVNDYGMEDGPWDKTLRDAHGVPVTAARQRGRFIELLHALRARGAPPDAVGLQAHTSGWISHRHQWEVYDQFATAGLPVHVTEFWAHTDELRKAGKMSEPEIEAARTRYVLDYLTCAFGHPAVEAFFFWGFINEAIQWFDRSAHEPRPVYEAVRRRLNEEWMTRLTAVSDAQGVVRFRGFYGDYVLRHPLTGGTSTGLSFAVSRAHVGAQTLILTHAVGVGG